MGTRWLHFKSRIVLLYKFFEDAFYDVFYDHKEGLHMPMTFSLGRTCFIIWFYITICDRDILFAAKNTLGVLTWALLGLSLLAYNIGRQNIITSIGGVNISGKTIDVNEINDHGESTDSNENS